MALEVSVPVVASALVALAAPVVLALDFLVLPVVVHGFAAEVLVLVVFVFDLLVLAVLVPGWDCLVVHDSVAVASALVVFGFDLLVLVVLCPGFHFFLFPGRVFFYRSSLKFLN